MEKKIFIISVFSILIFSCATAPKNLEKDSVIEDIMNSEGAIELQDNETPETDDYSDLEEALTPDKTDVLPELPEENIQQNAESLVKENEVIIEPEVKDEPVKQEEQKTPVSNDKNDASGMFGPEQNSSDTKELSTEAADESSSTSPSSEEENKNTEIQVDENVVTQEKTEPGKVSEIPKPSRSVKISKNQTLDIVYPGKGWIYQGNIDEEGNIDSRNRNFIFGGRKLGGSDTEFSLRSRNGGKYILHFYKNDTLTGNYIDDYLEVIVENKNANTTEHILAPDYAEIVPPKATITADKIKEEKKQKLAAQNPEKEQQLIEKKESEPSKKSSQTPGPKDSGINTIIQTSESSPKSDSPMVKTEASEKKSEKTVTENTELQEKSLEDQNADELLSTAKKHYENKEYPKAYSAISKFFDKATSRLDEGLYLRGQILEEKSSVQNIKNAIESYDLVVKNYPASPLWDKASKRSIFLKRFYINIR